MSESLKDLCEDAWGLIANAYGGDWDLVSEASGWKPAAEKWRDRWHEVLTANPGSSEAEVPV